MTISLIPVTEMAEIRPGDKLADLIADTVELRAGDIVVVTQKIVSKAEGRVVRISDYPNGHNDIVRSESRRVLRERNGTLISETRHGFICANAGVDESNVEDGFAALLPLDPDRSARKLRDRLRARTQCEVAVVISDTFGRPWRRGSTDLAIGIAGVAGVVDLRGEPDTFGRSMNATEIAVADEIASAAELVMGKARSIPVAVVRGIDATWLREATVATELIRAPQEDWFR